MISECPPRNPHHAGSTGTGAGNLLGLPPTTTPAAFRRAREDTTHIRHRKYLRLTKLIAVASTAATEQHQFSTVLAQPAAA